MGAQVHFPNYLAVIREEEGAALRHLGPSFQNLSHGDCVFTYNSEGGGKQAEKEKKRNTPSFHLPLI